MHELLHDTVPVRFGKCTILVPNEVFLKDPAAGVWFKDTFSVFENTYVFVPNISGSMHWHIVARKLIGAKTGSIMDDESWYKWKDIAKGHQSSFDELVPKCSLKSMCIYRHDKVMMVPNDVYLSAPHMGRWTFTAFEDDGWFPVFVPYDCPEWNKVCNTLYNEAELNGSANRRYCNWLTVEQHYEMFSNVPDGNWFTDPGIVTPAYQYEKETDPENKNDTDYVLSHLYVATQAELERLKAASTVPDAKDLKSYVESQGDRWAVWKFVQDDIPVNTVNPGQSPFKYGSPMYNYYSVGPEADTYTPFEMNARCDGQEDLYSRLLAAIQKYHFASTAKKTLGEEIHKLNNLLSGVPDASNMAWDLRWAEAAVTTWIEMYMVDEPIGLDTPSEPSRVAQHVADRMAMKKRENRRAKQEEGDVYGSHS